MARVSSNYEHASLALACAEYSPKFFTFTKACPIHTCDEYGCSKSWPTFMLLRALEHLSQHVAVPASQCMQLVIVVSFSVLMAG